MFNFSLNNMIDASAGLTLLHLSLSGIMCHRNRSQSSSNSSDQGCVSNNRTSCSMTNFNLGASSAGLTGALLLYRGLRR